METSAVTRTPSRRSEPEPAGVRRLSRSARVPSRAAGASLVALALLVGPPSLAGTEETPPAPSAPSAPPATGPTMEKLFDEFNKVELDQGRPLAVSNLTIKRDTMELTLGEGIVYLALPIEGRITGAYFKGRGVMKVSLPNAMDRKLLQKAYGRPAFEEAFQEAVLRFDDGAEKEILAVAKGGEALIGAIGTTWADRQRIDSNSSDQAVDFVDDTLNGYKSLTFFTAEIAAREGKQWFAFVHSGRDRIENGLFLERAMGTAGKRWYEVVSMFHRPQEYDAKGNYVLMPQADNKDTALVRHVQMTVEIPNTKSLNIDARLTVEARQDDLRAVRFDFINNLDAATWNETGRPVKLTLVVDGDDKPLPAMHRWHQLLVRLPQPLAKGEKTVIRVKATEDTIIQLTTRSYWIYTTYPWFPQIGYLGGRYTTDWTVKTSKSMTAAGTGDLVKQWTEGDLQCGQWKSDVPVQFASLIFGEFKITDGSYKRAGPEGGEVPLRLFTIQGGSDHFKGNPKNVLFNIAEGLKHYESIFGPYPFAQLDIAEMAKYMGFAQAPAGILLVSSVAVGGTVFYNANGVATSVNVEEQGGLGKVGGGGVGDQFVYHELAHQWWGHQIGWASDEDAWISESFAEYSAGLIINAIDPKRFDTMRAEWRKRAFEADPHGTIATAYRSSSVDFPAARNYLLYNKGPYVIHMLRTWMGWEKFTKFVGTVQSKYQGTNINTDTLAREASAVMGYDMFPFFDQWVRDSGIPKIRWSWSSAPDSDGKQLVTIKTMQEDKANPKILMVPITFDFGKGEPVIVPKPILKAEAVIQVKVPSVPKAIRMDEGETQLATFVSDMAKK